MVVFCHASTLKDQNLVNGYAELRLSVSTG